MSKDKDKTKQELDGTNYAISAYEEELNAIIAGGFEYLKKSYEKIREECHENLDEPEVFDVTVQYLCDRIGTELSDQTTKLFYEIGKHLCKAFELEEKLKQK